MSKRWLVTYLVSLGALILVFGVVAIGLLRTDIDQWQAERLIVAFRKITVGSTALRIIDGIGLDSRDFDVMMKLQ